MTHKKVKTNVFLSCFWLYNFWINLQRKAQGISQDLSDKNEICKLTNTIRRQDIQLDFGIDLI